MHDEGRTIGRQVLIEEEASANYLLRRVRLNRTRKVTWEVIETESRVAVATGLSDREEALLIVHRRLEGAEVTD